MSRPIDRLLPIGAVSLALWAAGCGATPPQAPLAQARKLNTALSGISTACGLSYQVTAFPGDHEPNLTTLEDTASVDTRELASIYKQNRAWIYQGDTISELVSDSLTMLHSCGLTSAALTLVKATSRR